MSRPAGETYLRKNMNIHLSYSRIQLTEKPNTCFFAILVGLAFIVSCSSLSAANAPPEPAAVLDSADNPAEKSAKAEQQKKIAALIEQLGDKDYFLRQKAQDELSKMGFEAFEALSTASTSDDLETATRAKYLLKLMRVEWTTATDPPEVKRLLKNYEMLDIENREDRIKALAALPEGSAIPALCRLARYEKSNVLSKRAALELMQSTPAGDPPSTQRVNLIRKIIESGSRPAVQWINAWLRMARDPQAALADFQRLADAETQLLQRTPDDTSPEVVTAFMRYYIAQLKRLGKTDAMVQAMQRLIEVQKDDSATIADLAEWFLEQKSWGALDDLAAKFAVRFDAEPILLYLHAEAKLAQNDTAKAEELAAKAIKLNPGREFVSLHYLTARNLKKRGCIDWAVKEFEYILSQVGDQDAVGYRPVMELAEIYYDQGKNLEAAKSLDKFLKKPSAQRFFASSPVLEASAKMASAEMNYYYGCHFESQGDRKQQRAYMEKAIATDPTNVNALIGFYHLPDLTPEEKQKAVELIKKTADTVRESILKDQQSPNDPRESLSAASKEASDCNEFAWLIANTEGNFNEALRYARRAVELQPTGSNYDTLAHAFYAKDDFENAVKTEDKAHELEPHSEMIKKKLELFKKALAEKKK
jgi:tetratricopeptide (TPR) repeat protein